MVRSIQAQSTKATGLRREERCTESLLACLGFALLVSYLTLATPALADEKAEFRPPAIRVPEGFVVELVAAPPLVVHPMMAGFDERGRLFVADSSGENLPAEELLENPPNVIRMLEDTDGDGQFDRSTVFADRMTFPMGALWHRGALYVASPPEIWRLEDTDDDGVADVREELVSKFGFSGNAASIHGCFLGPCGRIYWCDGRHGHEFVDSDGNQLSKGLAARVFSCRPDGSDLQVFCGGGMDNPVEVAFTATGEMLGTMTFYNPDEVRHDALVHFVYGGVYPRRHACTSEFKRTGELMPALVRFNVVAPSGLCRMRGTQFGDANRDHVFTAHFNTHTVARHTLSRDGATFRSEDTDFLVSDDADFHPTDVLEDADGSLLVIDTGGWFRIGCPTSQVAKPEILGAIYRVRRADASTTDDPRGLNLAWAEASASDLTERLDDDRHAVRDRAIDELALRGDAALAALTGSDAIDSQRARLGAVWALSRIDSSAALAAVRDRLNDAKSSVRLAAVHSAGVSRDTAAVPALTTIARTDEPALRREAATALGRIGDSAPVAGLMESLASGGDRFLEHALIYALIEIDDYDATASGLSHPSPLVRRGALIALDQMNSGRLTREVVTPLLDTDDEALQQAALDVITRRAGWAAGIIERLDHWLADPDATSAQRKMLRGALLAFRGDEPVQQLIGAALSKSDTPTEHRLLLLEVISRAELDPLPQSWIEPLAACLEAGDLAMRRQAIAATRAAPMQDFQAALTRIGRDASQPEALRAAALAVIAASGGLLDGSAFDLLLGRLDGEVAPLERLAAAEALATATLDREQRMRLAGAIEDAGPLELPALAAAFEQPGDREIGLRLVQSLEKSPGAVNLPSARLRKLFEHYPDAVTDAAQKLLQRGEPDDPARRARLAQLEEHGDAGEAVRGRDVFFSKKTACSACHRVGQDGGNIGPDLSTIGQVRTRRDLLEAVLFPSLSFSRGFESYTLATRSGRLHSGVIQRETAEAIYLRTSEQAEIRIERSQIDEIVASNVSVMPQGMDQVMNDGELRDLGAYLQSLK